MFPLDDKDTKVSISNKSHTEIKTEVISYHGGQHAAVVVRSFDVWVSQSLEIGVSLPNKFSLGSIYYKTTRDLVLKQGNVKLEKSTNWKEVDFKPKIEATMLSLNIVADSRKSMGLENREVMFLVQGDLMAS